ncbi:hypothetical protein VMCG_08721 [Cytospora schulzeri]|uniref:Microbial-type PARG catalytic domain-containing protein n=1 Tax=Cytospora schulzeri TaxID=448051 RepID=A0A423VQJ6_9PEZI|nr:hypothetical protein VMCG_08721 [Valsa malicola]
MGRTEPSIGRPPPAFRRDARAKKAKATINKVIPSLLSAHPRARRGIDAADLIVAPKPQMPSKVIETPSSEKSASAPGLPSPRLTIRACDTLTAAHSLLNSPANTTKKVAILNMASPLSPGGGFVNGATSQEEYLCMRTTLLPSLRDEFYRLPEVGCVFTPDVLVFRDAEGNDLDKKDRWFVDVISAAMLRLPETEVDEDTGRGGYVHQKDRELVVDKMRAVMRVAQMRGAQKVVLGAWGCGAYGNPVGEIARAWRRVLLGGGEGKGKGKRKGAKSTDITETWEAVEEVVFAISDAGMADGFKAAFGDGLEWADEMADEDDSAGEDNAEETRVREVQERMAELRLRIGRAPNERMKSGLEAVLAGLKSQIPEQEPVQNSEESGSEDDDDGDEEVVSEEDYQDVSEQAEDEDEEVPTDDEIEAQHRDIEASQDTMERK